MSYYLRMSELIETLDQISDRLHLIMRENFHRDGAIYNAILGYNIDGVLDLTILQGEYGDRAQMHESENDVVYIIPAPLRDHSTGITKLCRSQNIVALAMMSENWTYPLGEEGLQATEAFMRGDGPRPSEHPQRRELVTMYVTCPLVGYERFVGWNIKRTNRAAPRLRPAFDSKKESPDATLLSFASSWLEECLPQPDDEHVAKASEAT